MKTRRSSIVLAALLLTCTAAIAAPRASHVTATPTLAPAAAANVRPSANYRLATTPMLRLVCGVNVPLCYCRSGVPC